MVGDQLYICGRKKDLIIIGGRNIYPEDVELSVSDIEGLASDRSVAIGVVDPKLGTERLVLICELKKQLTQEQRNALGARIRQRIYEELEIAPGDVSLQKRGWIVKTANGKISRAQNLAKYQASMAANVDE